MLLQAPTLYDILIYSCIQHMDFPFACGAGDLSIGSREWAARPALISAYLQELCARSKDSRQIFALGCNVAVQPTDATSSRLRPIHIA